MSQRSIMPTLALVLAAVAFGTPSTGAAEGKTPADPNKEAKSGEGAKEAKGEKAAKKDPKDMNADEAEAAGLCPVCKNEHKLVYRFTHGEKIYHFATRECKKAFGDNPAKYGAAGAAGDKKEGAAKKTEAAKTEAAEVKTAKTEAAEKTEKAEKTEGGDAMGGGMMGGDQMGE